MKNSVEARLTRLVEQLAADSGGKLKIVFADGHVELLNGADAVDLVLSRPDMVGRVVALSNKNGLLPDLLNGLLEI